MDEVQELITELRVRGWTVAALARELEVDYRTIIRWQNGQRTPANVAGVRSLLRGLLQRRRIPKRKVYKRNPPATS
jgi:transcriptional regulator with XRE-family HTH domain